MNTPIFVMWQNEMLSVAHILSYSFKDRPGFYVFNKVNTVTGNSNQLTCWVSKEIRCILWNLMVRYCVHNSHLVFLIIKQMNTFYILNAHLFNTSFTVIISFRFVIPILVRDFYQNSGEIHLKNFPLLCVLLHVLYFLLYHLCSCIYWVNVSFLILTYFLLYFFFYSLEKVLLQPQVHSKIFHIWEAVFFMRNVAIASNKDVKV